MAGDRSDRPAGGNPAGDLPTVPVLLYSGQRDLSTPQAWAREEAAKAPDGRLVSVPGAGHSVQLRATDPTCAGSSASSWTADARA